MTRVILSSAWPSGNCLISREEQGLHGGGEKVTVWGVETLTASACCKRRGLHSSTLPRQNSVPNQKRFDSVGMDNDSLYCCIVLIVLASLATGVPCLFYGYKCNNDEQRTEHKSDHCKNIHNDKSARALQAFGWIFSIPWLIAAIYILAKCCESDSTTVSPENQESRNGGGSTHIVVCF